ncbi:MAG: prepilin-type N-terminal cleavage/methylation domain-containing protein [Candidatus Riflebacteria bacterium]|nr:prepilin-type N-terminal cleavage/methylation domain-containing protein [Candidatus Riflebacteria bacterium]
MSSSSSKRGFSLLEVLIVVMLISAGILPIYSLIKSGQKRIVRADTRTMGTLYGASAIELARTIGFDKALKLDEDKDYIDLRDNAKKNGFDLAFSKTLQPMGNQSQSTRQVFLLRVEILVRNFNRTLSDSPEQKFMTILTDPRFNFY